MATNRTRTSRATESRAAEEIHESHPDDGLMDIDFSPANLDTTNIPPREGYDQRWVRTKVGSEDDQSNVYKNIKLGWTPRKADTVKNGQYLPQVEFKGDNIIGVHDSILMERPTELSIKHKAYEQKLADDLIKAAEQDMHKVHDRNSGLTRPEMRNRSNVSRGRVAPISDD